LVTEGKAMAIEDIHTYCPMCIAQCGVIAVVEDGRFTKVRPDSEHPNGGICIKGSAAPELVYAPDRLKYPMKRTRPKGDADPGWVEISWEEALDTVASRLLQIKAESELANARETAVPPILEKRAAHHECLKMCDIRPK
jgi:anaerobic selenocysteine-containing dehydrogenase